MSELNREIADSVDGAQRALNLDAVASLGTAEIPIVLEEIVVRHVVRHLGALPALRKRLLSWDAPLRGAVVARIEAALRSMDNDFVHELCCHPRVDVSPEFLSGLLGDSPVFGRFGLRIAQRAFERLIGERVAPALKQRWAVSREELARELPGEFTHAIVFGEMVGAVEEIFPLILDAYAVDMERCGNIRLNVVGVYAGWLEAQEHASHILYYNHAAGELYEAELAEPLEFQSCQLLYLGANETTLQEELVHRLEPRTVFNSVEVSRCCDDKFRTAEILRQRGLRTPRAAVLSAERGSTRIPEALASSGLQGCGSLVLQPNQGTEGAGAKVVLLDSYDQLSQSELTSHIERYFVEGTREVLVRERVDCIRLEESDVSRATSIRVNVAWDGCRSHAESGYVQIAGRSEPDIASVGRGGTIAPLSGEMLEQLRISPVEFAQVRGAAAAAVAAIVQSVGEHSVDIGLFGVDLLLQRQAGELLVWVLEINSRPAGLSHSDLLDTGEPGVSPILFESLLERLMSVHNGVKTSERNAANWLNWKR